MLFSSEKSETTEENVKLRCIFCLEFSEIQIFLVELCFGGSVHQVAAVSFSAIYDNEHWAIRKYH